MLKIAIKNSILVFILSFSYAFIRYNILKEVSINEIPLYIINKAVSISSVILMFLSIINSNSLSKYYGRTSVYLAVLHVFLSLIILSPTYFPQIYNENKTLMVLNSISLLLGCISLTTLLFYQLSKVVRDISKKSSLVLKIVLLTISGHIFFWGIKSWLTPSNWPFGLPPITLLSFIIIIITLLILFIKNRKPRTLNI